MPYTSQPDSPGANEVLTDAFVQTMLDNIAALKALIDDIEDRSLKQRVLSSVTDATINSTSYADASGLSVSITTTGGRLRIYLKGSNTVNEESDITLTGPGTGLLEGHVRAVVGATNLGACELAADNGAGDLQQATFPPPFGEWESTPAAGTYTVKIQVKKAGASTTTNVQLQKLILVVEEWGT